MTGSAKQEGKRFTFHRLSLRLRHKQPVAAAASQVAPRQPEKRKKPAFTLPPAVAIPRRESASLLGLPAELRNCIYEYALGNEGQKTMITAELKEPALLRTNRQTRSETLKLWYTMSDFEIDVYRLDYTLFQKWTSRLMQLGFSIGGPMVRCHECFDWAKVVSWCKVVWADENAFCLTKYEGMTARTFGVVASAHEVASLCRSRKWKRCEELLENLRTAISLYEPRWTTNA